MDALHVEVEVFTDSCTRNFAVEPDALRYSRCHSFFEFFAPHASPLLAFDL